MNLPQCEIFTASPAHEILFVSGGRVPNRDWFKKVSSGRKIFCVDKGIEFCRACEVVTSSLME